MSEIMSPELIAAVQDRIKHGYTEEAIRAELLAAGHTEEVITSVLQSNQGAGSVSASNQPSVAVYESSVSVFTLIKEGMSLMFKRYDLVLALALPTSVVTVLSLFYPSSAVMLLGVVSLLLLVWYILAMTATLYIVTNEASQTISLTSGLQWAKHNIWGLGWVYFLVAVVSYGGYILFIIPGIIVSVLTFFTPYVYVQENKRGLDALLRSRDLVRGRWGQVFGKLLKIIFILLGLMFAFSLVLVPFSLLFNNEELIEIVFGIVFQFAGAGLTIMLLSVGHKIYQDLLFSGPPPVASQPDRWKYKTLAWLGVLLPVPLIIFLTVAIFSLSQVGNSESLTELGLEQQLSQVRIKAEIYHEETGSYQGFCPQMAEDLEGMIYRMDCIDQSDDWAMTLSHSSESMLVPLCIDANTAPAYGTISIDTATCDFMGVEYEDPSDAKQRLREL